MFGYSMNSADIKIHQWKELFGLFTISFDFIDKDDIHPWTPNKSQKCA